MSTVSTASDATTYVYDDSTNRIQKRLANGGRVSYVGQETETDEAGRATDYIFASGDRLITIDPTEGLLYNIEDHLSSASLIVKGGTIVQKLDYYPYGTERVNDRVGAFSARHTFTDKEKDQESGLQYFGARYYNPTIGRFTGVDPLEGNIFDPQSLNRYAYSRNNPLRYVDPTGQSFNDVVNDLSKSYADLYSRTGALAVGIPVFLAKNPSEAGKIGVTLLPVVGESIDSYEVSTGKDFFNGSSVSGERRALTIAGLASGFGSGRLARMGDEIGEAGEAVFRDSDSIKLLGQPIEITDKRLNDVVQKHTLGGSKFAQNKSYFNNGVDIKSTILEGTHQMSVLNVEGFYERTWDTGRSIGVDRGIGKQTSVMSVITDGRGKMITAHPGKPGKPFTRK